MSIRMRIREKFISIMMSLTLLQSLKCAKREFSVYEVSLRYIQFETIILILRIVLLPQNFGATTELLHLLQRIKSSVVISMNFMWNFHIISLPNSQGICVYEIFKGAITKNILYHSLFKVNYQELNNCIKSKIRGIAFVKYQNGIINIGCIPYERGKKKCSSANTVLYVFQFNKVRNAIYLPFQLLSQ